MTLEKLEKKEDSDAMAVAKGVFGLIALTTMMALMAMSVGGAILIWRMVLQ